MTERLTRRTRDLEVQVSSLARRVVSLDKELYSTYLSKSQLTRNTEFFALGGAHHKPCGGVCRERLTPRAPRLSSPRCINVYRQHTAGCNPAMD